jgi:hypothetical protein
MISRLFSLLTCEISWLTQIQQWFQHIHVTMCDSVYKHLVPVSEMTPSITYCTFCHITSSFVASSQWHVSCRLNMQNIYLTRKRKKSGTMMIAYHHMLLYLDSLKRQRISQKDQLTSLKLHPSFLLAQVSFCLPPDYSLLVCKYYILTVTINFACITSFIQEYYLIITIHSYSHCKNLQIPIILWHCKCGSWQQANEYCQFVMPIVFLNYFKFIL